MADNEDNNQSKPKPLSLGNDLGVLKNIEMSSATQDDIESEHETPTIKKEASKAKSMKPRKRRELRAQQALDQKKVSASQAPAVNIPEPSQRVEAVMPPSAVNTPEPADASVVPASIAQPTTTPTMAASIPQPAEKKVPTDKPMQEMSATKRKIVQRRKENRQQLEKMQKEIASAQSEVPIEMVKQALDDELAKQEKLKEDISAIQNDIRELRQKEADIRSSRAKTEAEIADRRARIVELRRVKKDPGASPEEKKAATAQISDLEDEVSGYRQLHADEGAELAKFNEQVQDKLKARQEAQTEMSESKVSSRELKSVASQRETLQFEAQKAESKDVGLEQDLQDYEQKRKQRDLSEAQRLTPQSFRRQVTAAEPVDPKKEAYIATQRLGRDAHFGEKKEYRQVSQEFNELINAIKGVKTQLADLEEGTEEYAEKQKELSKLETEATERSVKMRKIERDVQEREAAGGSIRRRAVDGLRQGVSGAFGMVGSALSAGSQGAIERYVTEEERKSAEIRLQAQEVSDYRNRYTNASSLLATGAGRLFGAEMPYDVEKGGTSKAVQALGTDVVRATRAMPGVELTTQVASGMTQSTIDALEAGVGAAANSPLTGVVGAPLAAAGRLGTGMLRTGAGAIGTIASSPQLMAQVGADKLAGAVNRGIGTAADTLKTGGEAVGGFVSKGGGDGAKFAEGAGQVVTGVENLSKNVGTAIQRSVEQIKEQNKLLQAQVEAGQVGRIKERADLAFAPKLQSYLETMPMQRQINRSLGFQTRAEREQTQLNIENLSIDEQMTQMGFSPDQVIQATSSAAQAFGRHGRGPQGFDLIQRSVKSAAAAENLGMGDMSQSMAAMGQMMRGGAEDPESMFKKAMQEALTRGLSDSRDFQGLLSAASQTADNTVGFEGSLKMIADAAGTGRAGDLETAKSFADMLGKQTTGATGTFHDIVKMQQTKESIQDVIQTAEAGGMPLDQKATTQLLALSRMRPEDLQNREFAESIMGPEAMESIKAYEQKQQKAGKKDFDFFKDYAEKVNIRAGFTGAIEFTQDKDLVDVRNKILQGDKSGLQEMFGMKEGASDEDKKKGKKRLESFRAQMMSGTAGYYAGDEKAADTAIGATRFALNQLDEILGTKVEPGGIASKHAHGMTKEQAAKATEEAKLSKSTAEAAAGGQAGVEAEERKSVLGRIYDEKGQQKLFGTQEQEVARFKDREHDLESKVQASKTVQPTKDLKPLDEEVQRMVDGLQKMSESLKNFSMKDAVINVAGEVIVEAKQKVTAAVLDGAVSETLKSVGDKISSTIKEGVDSMTPSWMKDSKPQTPPAQPKQNTTKPIGS